MQHWNNALERGHTVKMIKLILSVKTFIFYERRQKKNGVNKTEPKEIIKVWNKKKSQVFTRGKPRFGSFRFFSVYFFFPLKDTSKSHNKLRMDPLLSCIKNPGIQRQQCPTKRHCNSSSFDALLSCLSPLGLSLSKWSRMVYARLKNSPVFSLKISLSRRLREIFARSTSLEATYTYMNKTMNWNLSTFDHYNYINTYIFIILKWKTLYRMLKIQTVQRGVHLNATYPWHKVYCKKLRLTIIVIVTTYVNKLMWLRRNALTWLGRT